jgi:hypothetical protein
MEIQSLQRFSRSVLPIVAIVLAAACPLHAQGAPTQPAATAQKLSQPIEIAAATSLPEAPGVAPAESSSAPVPAAVAPMAFAYTTETTPRPETHRFWDRENAILFTAVGGLATADFFVTRANLASGGKELNPVTRVLAGSTPALAANFALETSSIIGISYLFHRTHHHDLERATSFANIAASGAAIGYSATHR